MVKVDNECVRRLTTPRYKEDHIEVLSLEFAEELCTKEESEIDCCEEPEIEP